VQDELPARTALDKMMFLLPAIAVTVPPPHDPVNPFGVATAKPPGSVSWNEMPLLVMAMGFVIVKVREVLPPRGIALYPTIR